MEPQVAAPGRSQLQAAEQRPHVRTAAGLQFGPQADVPGQHDRRTHELAPVGRRVVGEVGPGAQGQGVGDAYQAGGAAQFGRQYAGVRLIALPRLHQVLRRQGEVPAPGVIQQAAEQGVGVEPGQAHPRDGAVQADQRGGRAVPDEAEVLQRQVARPPADGPERWIGIVHAASSPQRRIRPGASESHASDERTIRRRPSLSRRLRVSCPTPRRPVPCRRSGIRGSSCATDRRASSPAPAEVAPCGVCPRGTVPS